MPNQLAEKMKLKNLEKAIYDIRQCLFDIRELLYEGQKSLIVDYELEERIQDAKKDE